MLLRHTAYNLLGLGLPLLAAFISIPILIEILGLERFGLLTLIWAVISYFGLFDLGLGRAMTQQLALVLANGDNEKVGPLIVSSSVLIAGLGVGAGILLVMLAPWGVGLLKGVSDVQETLNAVYILALAMPAVVLTSGFRGVLEARHAFGIVNLIRLPMGLFTFLGPLAVVLYGQNRLDWIASVLAAGRFVACMAHGWYAWKVLPVEHGKLEVKLGMFRSVYSVGGWMTVSNIVSPLMGYIDRFFLGILISASAVAYFSTTQELVIKLWIVPGALTAVLFPTFAAQIIKRNEQSWNLFQNSVFWLFLSLLPVTVFLALFANEILTIWIDSEFASHSAILLQVFAFGILFNCLAHVPFVLIQSAGLSRLTAFVHIAELPGFIVVLWWLISDYGALGAAIAWLLRMLVDTTIMFVLGVRVLGHPISALLDRKILLMGLLTLTAFYGAFMQPLIIRVVWMTVLVVILALALFQHFFRQLSSRHL